MFFFFGFVGAAVWVDAIEKRHHAACVVRHWMVALEWKYAVNIYLCFECSQWQSLICITSNLQFFYYDYTPNVSSSMVNWISGKILFHLLWNSVRYHIRHLAPTSHKIDEKACMRSIIDDLKHFLLPVSMIMCRDWNECAATVNIITWSTRFLMYVYMLVFLYSLRHNCANFVTPHVGQHKVGS